MDSRNTRFDGDVTPHAHFYCKSCGRIEDLPLIGGEHLLQAVPESFDVSDVQVYYKGICRDCKHGTN